MQDAFFFYALFISKKYLCVFMAITVDKREYKKSVANPKFTTLY